MKSNIIVTTTNSIEGCCIKKYLKTICSNIVIGTNVFSDIAASFTDFFGGRSDIYRRKLDIIYDEALKELEQKAIKIGGNAIVGFRVDFTELSGKDKSMFLVSASGTACEIDLKTGVIDSRKTIFADELEQEITKINLIDSINDGKRINSSQINFLIMHPLLEIANQIINRYIEFLSISSDDGKEEAQKLEDIIRAYTKKDIVPIVYNFYEETKNIHITKLIKNCNLFDARRILHLCNKDINLAIEVLSANADEYNTEDLALMKQIVEKLTTVSFLGKIESVKSGLLGKMQEKYICPNGHKNDIDATFCTSCGLNIYGFNSDQVSKINLFKRKVEALSNLMA